MAVIFVRIIRDRFCCDCKNFRELIDITWQEQNKINKLPGNNPVYYVMRNRRAIHWNWQGWRDLRIKACRTILQGICETLPIITRMRKTKAQSKWVRRSQWRKAGATGWLDWTWSPWLGRREAEVTVWLGCIHPPWRFCCKACGIANW